MDRKMTRGLAERTIAKEVRQLIAPQNNRSHAWNSLPENIRAKKMDGSLIAINCQNPNQLMLFPLNDNLRYIIKNGIASVVPNINFTGTSFGIDTNKQYIFRPWSVSVDGSYNASSNNSASFNTVTNGVENFFRIMAGLTLTTKNPNDSIRNSICTGIRRLNLIFEFGSYSVDQNKSLNTDGRLINANTIRTNLSPDFYRITIQQRSSTVYGQYTYTEINGVGISNANKFMRYKILKNNFALKTLGV